MIIQSTAIIIVSIKHPDLSHDIYQVLQTSNNVFYHCVFGPDRRCTYKVHIIVSQCYIRLTVIFSSSASPQVYGNPGCTTTLHLPAAAWNLDHTTTIYEQTTTVPVAVDCGTCDNLATSSQYFGPGPVSLPS